MAVTACLKTSRPSIRIVLSFCEALSGSVTGMAEPPPGTTRISVRLPSLPITVESTRPSSGDLPSSRLLSTAAPAPSPKKHAGIAISPVNHAAQLFSADDEHRLAIAGVDEVTGGLQRKEEPGARRRDIEADRVLGAEVLLNVARRRREKRVRRNRGGDNEVEFLCGDAGLFHGLECGPSCQRSLVASPSAAIRRSRIPVLVWIHSSEVSTIFSRSALVSTLSGT